MGYTGTLIGIFILAYYNPYITSNLSNRGEMIIAQIEISCKLLGSVFFLNLPKLRPKNCDEELFILSFGGFR